MSKTFESVLSSLREFGSSCVDDLDKLSAQHQAWLTSAVEDVKAKIAELGGDYKPEKVVST